MKLISREFEFERQPQSGWDPYDVWCTRVRADLGPVVPITEPPRKLRAVPDIVPPTPEKPVPAGATKKERAANAVLPIVFVLLIVLALSRELVGLFGFDVVAAVFGVMTPAARVIHVLLGVSALYCAFVLSLQRRRRATEGRRV